MNLKSNFHSYKYGATQIAPPCRTTLEGRAQIAKAALHHCSIKDRTWGSFNDDEERHAELDYLIGKLARCQSIDLYDTPYNQLVYSVTIPIKTGYIDRDEDGAYADTEDQRVRIQVAIKSDMTLWQIASNVAKEIADIELGRFGGPTYA